MKTIEVLIPQSVKECTPDQLTKWMLMIPVIEAAKENLTKMLDFQVQLVSVFSGLSVNQVKKAHIDDVVDLSMKLLDMLNGYEYQEPKTEMIIEGKKYLFEKDFAGYSTGQIIDLKLIEDVSQNPCEALAICYIEEDMEYCQEDARGKIINPNKKREELFKKSFPGDEFLNFFAFFFPLIGAAEARYLGDQDGEDEDREGEDQSGAVRDSEWFTWTKIIHSLSKELNKDIDEITAMPYVKTLFWMNYLKLKTEQDYILLKHG